MLHRSARHWTLGVRLTVAIVVLLLVLQSVVIVSFLANLAERRHREVENAVVVAQILATVVDGFARDLESTTLAVGLVLGTEAPTLDQASAGAYLQALFEQYGVLRSLFITDLQGRILASHTGAQIGLDLSSRPYVRAFQAGADVVWSDGIAGVQTGEVTVALGRVLRARDGTPRGYLVAAFYPQQVWERLSISVPPDASVNLVDEHGVLLYSSNSAALPTTSRSFSESPGVRDALAGQTVRFEDEPTPFAAEPSYGAYVPTRHVGWVVAFTRPQPALEAALWTQFVYQTGVTALVMVGAAVFLVLLTRRLTRPLTELASTASAIAKGERPVVPIVEADPKVVQLATAMRVMGEAVAKREDSLRFLAEASQGLATSLDFETTLRTIARLAVPTLADWCVVDVVELDEQIHRVAVVCADPANEDLARELKEQYPPDPDRPEGVPKVLRTGQPELYPEVSDAWLRDVARDSRHLAIMQQFRPRSFMIVPLLARGRTLGTLMFITAESGRRYGPDDLMLAEELASRAALAVDNARLYREMQEALRLRDDLLSLISHDLRNPLTAIKGNAQLLQRRLAAPNAPHPEQLQAGLVRIDQTAGQMQTLIDELLDLARLQSGQPLPLNRRPLDLVALARRAAEDYQAATESHQIRVEANVGVLTGQWDAARLERVLGNLLGNAIKYSPAGGKITVTVRREESVDGPLAVLSVRDEGVGILSTDLPHIFQPFQRGSNIAEQIRGAGLGLASTRQIVEQHGGTISASSVEGAGSTFTIRLPLQTTEEPNGEGQP